MNNLTEYSSNYSDTTGSLWFYYKDQATIFTADIANTNSFKSFEYKDKLFEYPVANGNNSILRNETIAVLLKHLLNCWRSFEMTLVNCKVESKLRWRKYCVLASADAENDGAKTSNIICTTKDTKVYVFYVPAVTLSSKDN